jgi:hypothetical protein
MLEEIFLKYKQETLLSNLPIATHHVKTCTNSLPCYFSLFSLAHAYFRTLQFSIHTTIVSPYTMPMVPHLVAHWNHLWNLQNTNVWILSLGLLFFIYGEGGLRIEGFQIEHKTWVSHLPSRSTHIFLSTFDQTVVTNPSLFSTLVSPQRKHLWTYCLNQVKDFLWNFIMSCAFHRMLDWK